jgi:hypothetical protein
MTAPQPGDDNYDAVKQGVPVVILDGADDLGASIDALTAAVLANTIAVNALIAKM